MNIKKKFEILTYNIGFIQKDIDQVMNNGLSKSDIVWMKHNYKDRFFADPFLIESDDKYFYVLCEEYLFWERKGKITLLKISKSDYTLIERNVIIEEKTHLSFPCCEYHGRLVSPESSASGKYYEYEIDFENKCIINKRLILNEGTVDGVFYKNGNEKFLLAGKTKIPSTELYLYKEGSNGLYNSCFDEPVLSDNRCARGAGNFFVWHNKIYRPVQDCMGRYGRQTKIMEISKLDDSGYVANEHITLNSFDNPPFNETMHTFNVYNDVILVDGSKDVCRFPMKLFYKKFPGLFNRRKDI